MPSKNFEYKLFLNMGHLKNVNKTGTITRGIFGGWYVIEHNDMREKRFETLNKAVEYAELNKIKLLKPSLM